MKRVWKFGRAAAVIASVIGLAACDEKPLEPELKIEEQIEALGAGVHPVFSLARRTSDTVSITVHLKQVQMEELLGSYQGEIEFKPELAFVDALVPDGVMAAWNEVSPGRIRVAGVALDGFPNGHVITLRFVRSGALRGNQFTMTVEELVGATSLENLTKRMIARDHPLFSDIPIQ